MRYHRRNPLPPSAQTTLLRWQRELNAEWAKEALRPATEQRPAGEVADAHWRNRRSLAMRLVRRTPAVMASPDMERCMYCEHDRGGEIDHGQPKSEALDRTYDWDNFVWACGRCNLDKLTRYDASMVIPTVDDPLDFLHLAAEGRWTRYRRPRGREAPPHPPHGPHRPESPPPLFLRHPASPGEGCTPLSPMRCMALLLESLRSPIRWERGDRTRRREGRPLEHRPTCFRGVAPHRSMTMPFAVISTITRGSESFGLRVISQVSTS